MLPDADDDLNIINPVAGYFVAAYALDIDIDIDSGTPALAAVVRHDPASDTEPDPDGEPVVVRFLPFARQERGTS
ncbi:hypothetical protein [Streptomyces sp. NPDC059466]|uniref:hypothetical protein n=1 Tax=unclassified Streptomyces TaxID=2593676 RepID=UPI003683DC0F